MEMVKKKDEEEQKKIDVGCFIAEECSGKKT